MDAFLPTYPRKKISCGMFEGKKISCKHIPQEKKSVWIKGWKKNSCTYQITHPSLPKVKWLASNNIYRKIPSQGNSELNCTRNLVSHESRSDECDIGFQVQFKAEFTSQCNEFSLNSIIE